jgi:hypothetical protein
MTPLLGLTVRSPDACRCTSALMTIGDGNVLICGACQRRCSILSSSTANWLQQVVKTFGRPTGPIVLRQKSNCPPRLPAHLRGALRFEMLTATALTIATDGCFSRTLARLLRDGISAVPAEHLLPAQSSRARARRDGTLRDGTPGSCND